MNSVDGNRIDRNKEGQMSVSAVDKSMDNNDDILASSTENTLESRLEAQSNSKLHRYLKLMRKRARYYIPILWWIPSYDWSHDFMRYDDIFLIVLLIYSYMH